MKRKELLNLLDGVVVREEHLDRQPLARSRLLRVLGLDELEVVVARQEGRDQPLCHGSPCGRKTSVHHLQVDKRGGGRYSRESTARLRPPCSARLCPRALCAPPSRRQTSPGFSPQEERT